MANIITGIRIICSLTLLLCPTFSAWFYAFYIVCGISDLLDGKVARYLGKETKFGARLDTVADIIYFIIVLIKILPKINIPIWLIIWFICIAVIKIINIANGVIVYKRFVSEHTVMNKMTGVLLFTFPLYIGNLSGYIVEILLILTCIFATFATIQEGYYIRMGKEII